MPDRSHPLVLSIDLDEWYHCRWATGYEHSIWKTTGHLFREVYHADRPRGDLIPPGEWLLEQLAKRRLQATFFVLGEVAEWYPDLLRTIAGAGHEIACHGMVHQDMTVMNRPVFTELLRKAKRILEDVTGQSIVGYRAPNLVVAPYLADVLEESGFSYDSSVCPARAIRGKYEAMSGCPQWPYRIGDTVQQQGTRMLWELPIPTMPLLGLPACTGVATRVFGSWWTRFALWWWGRRGSVLYYFHPYEVWYDVLPPTQRLYVRLFMRNRGRTMQRRAMGIVDRYRSRVVCARNLVTSLGAERECPPRQDVD